MPTSLTQFQQAILRAVANEQANTGTWLTGSKLRALFRDQGRPAVSKAISPLVPRYLESLNKEPDEVYKITLSGMQAARPADVAVILGNLLYLLRQKLDQEPDFLQYTWDEVKSANQGLTDDALGFVALLIDRAGLGAPGPRLPGPPVQASWYQPAGVEDIADLDPSDFIRRREAEGEAALRTPAPRRRHSMNWWSSSASASLWTVADHFTACRTPM